MSALPKNQIICTEFDGGDGILVDLRTRRYYQLNETALIVWKGLENGDTVEGIANQISSGYDVEPGRARTSVETLITRFHSYRLLTEVFNVR